MLDQQLSEAFRQLMALLDGAAIENEEVKEWCMHASYRAWRPRHGKITCVVPCDEGAYPLDGRLQNLRVELRGFNEQELALFAGTFAG
jgi:hypothetical protein